MALKRTINRRDFLCFSLLGLGGVALAACRSRVGIADGENYYLEKKDEILKEFDEILSFVQKVCTDKYDQALAKTLIEETHVKLEDLLVELPYIGGQANDLTSNLTQSAGALAFYRTMLDHDKTLEETGEVLYRALESLVSATPMLQMSGRMAMSKMAQDKFSKEALSSQRRTYPEDWVFEFIEGDGKTFDYGIDYLECGICKYYQAQKAEELTPYLCLLDFPFSRGMNTGLVRTTTLAHGGERCDFRYKAGRQCQMEWQPDFLKTDREKR